jgi:hypothetical protein
MKTALDAVVPTKERIPLDDEVFAFDIAEPALG